MFALNLGENGRVLSAMPEELATEDMPRAEALPDGDISTYRFTDGAFMQDAALVAELEQAAARLKIGELKGKLLATDGAVLEGLEALLSCKSVTELLAALVKTAAGLKDVLESRAAIRTEISELEA